MISAKKKKFKSAIEYEILLLPALLGFAIIFLYPAVKSIIYSFTDFSVFNRTISFIGLKNFIDIFHDDRLTAAIKNSTLYAVSFTVLQSAFAIPLAVALDSKIKTRNILRTVYYMPHIFSALIIGYVWSFNFSTSSFGLINNTLKDIGLGFLAQNWLGDPRIAIYSCIFVAVWQGTGYAMMLYVANLQSIPREMYESAVIDGASPFQSFRHITFSFLAPAMTITTLTGMIGGLKVYEQIVALTNGGPGYATETLTTALMYRGFTENRYGYASALAVIMMIGIMIISFIQLQILSKREDKLL
ncbi:carbohydrate ABC transporter permease [Cohnella zeiphila]|uniref:Sugar ABC transporter permease n=1 Tax=Cohnella zeiphila TaxID=2761120 RepID=A0A7X0SL00_9BACL|nr:sugar ABC transporter permease [Cohnella zeiphila]MBB6731945.1 sugar ABC transporter permease [Cohnella zeiphila]